MAELGWGQLQNRTFTAGYFFLCWAPLCDCTQKPEIGAQACKHSSPGA